MVTAPAARTNPEEAHLEKPMLSLKRPAVLVLSLLLSTTSWAADKDGNYAVWGAGGQSCNRYNEAHEKGDEDEYRFYAMGYLTAYHTFVPETYQLAPGKAFADVMALVADYCTRVPMDSFQRALKLTAEELAPERRKKAPTRRDMR
jgi:hypothetical protein